ncbi:helicase [Microbacterium sp. cx-55]|uniref:helicase n=1 Tax=unclassified Microbacterium TaxID=2609290 RepID=UPI001CC12C2F|nr:MULTISPECIES: helicase [unclassified Microbacterium]MBZ4488031.1 helicase [Microbacterium sp. cx-55]MCC4908940.1 helicase [Microbacterium sp. cx-59]UGB34562.1 helicase [Microbacterium sp. cx-55]
MAGSAASTGVVAVIVTLTLGLAAAGAAAVHAQRLSGTADAAALAAADAASGAVSGSPCARADEIATRAAAEVVSCEVVGLIATIRVSAAFGPFPASAAARAGPPPGQTIVVGR